jgi:hypothetical protein
VDLLSHPNHRRVAPAARAAWTALLCGLALLTAGHAEAPGKAIRGELPAAIHAGSHYVFYLHGAIVEGADRRPLSPRFGIYEYDAILKALAAPGRIVVSAQRPRGARPEVWAERTAAGVERLLGAGVPPSAIAVVGFSKGGAITILTSARLEKQAIRYVLMGACGDWLSAVPDLRLHGDVLSLVEASDNIGHSCRPLCRRSPAARCTEKTLHTGLGHGAFYRPRSDWLAPTLAWLKAR